MVSKKNKWKIFMISKNIFIKTFGCQMNEYDSNRIYDSVRKLGFKKTNYDCSGMCGTSRKSRNA